MLKYFAAGFTAALLLFGALGPAAAEKRVALVIGNSAYQHTAALKNPSNDATDMAATLQQLGFDVIDGNDLTKEEMEQRIRAFAAKLAGADVGLFFYAGHGPRSTERTSSRPWTPSFNPIPTSTSRQSSSTSC